MYAKVIVEIGVKNVDRMFTYIVPQDMKNTIKIGCRVKVEFGRQLLEGFVIELTENIDKVDYELKSITSLVDMEPILNNEMLELGNTISNITLCSLISAYQVMLPKALKASYDTNINIKMDKYLVLNNDKSIVLEYINNCRYDGQKKILNNIINNNELKISKIDSAVKTLIKHGLIKIIEKESYRYKYESINKDNKVKLNKEQEYSVNKVTECFGSSKTFLLYGVTGSGKTEVYMNIIDNAINIGKSAIMLVPEISLTPQIVSRFVSRFGDNVAILHSGLSDGERYD